MEIPVFPLEKIVLFPGTVLPLNILESHYEKMLYDAYENNQLVAIGLGDVVENSRGQQGAKYLSPRNIMGLGEIEEIEQLEDGSLTVQFRGQGICRIENYTQQIPFLKANVTAFLEKNPSVHLFEDSLTLDDGHLEKYRILLNSWVHKEIVDSPFQKWLLKEIVDPKTMVHYICTFVIQSPELKQTLLETHGLAEKVRILDAVLAHHLHLDGQAISQLGQVFANQTVSEQIAAFNHIEKDKRAAQ